MQNKILRCIHESEFRAIKNGVFKNKKVGVYYGFDNYGRTAEQIMLLCDIVKTEIPHVALSDMSVYEITRAQSIRHANMTMIHVEESVENVANNIDNYTIL